MPESSQKSEARAKLLSYATNILSRRPYFRHALRSKLVKRAKDKGIIDAKQVIEDIISDLAASGYLDDAYLAAAFVRRQLSKGYGPKIIEYKLIRLGLSSSLVEEVLAQEATDEVQLEAAKKLYSKYSKLDPRRSYYKIITRGFGSGLVRKIFDVDVSAD